jgi:hypothetical protein
MTAYQNNYDRIDWGEADRRIIEADRIARIIEASRIAEADRIIRRLKKPTTLFEEVQESIDDIDKNPPDDAQIERDTLDWHISKGTAYQYNYDKITDWDDD